MIRIYSKFTFYGVRKASLNSNSKSKFFTTDGQSVYLGVEPTLGLVTVYYLLFQVFCLKVAVLYLWDALSDERTGLQFAVQSLNGPSRT
jgi:hypothetical protein